MKFIWSHLAYHNFTPAKNGSHRRRAIFAHGLFNQVDTLLLCSQFTKLLERELVVSGFYIDYKHRKSVPLSKIIDLSSLPVKTHDWMKNIEKQVQLSSVGNFYIVPPYDVKEMLDIIKKTENNHDHLEVGCCFNLQLRNNDFVVDHRNLRFHPIFYNIVADFSRHHHRYQVIHYRMETDFSAYF